MLGWPKHLYWNFENVVASDDQRYIAINGQNTDVYPLLGQVDHMITDPPYGAEVHTAARHTRGTDGVVTVKAIPFPPLAAFDRDALAQFAATKIKGGWSLICSQPEQIHEWREASRAATRDDATMKYFRAMAWVKPDGQPNFSGNGPAMGYEVIQSYWCGPGQSKWNGGGKTCVFTHVKRHTGSHPTEKPLPLMRELVTLFTNPGDIVFDPFMGSGSTGVACLELGRRFIGCERDPTYYATACKRLAAAAQVVPLYAEKAKPVALFEGEKAYATRGKKK